MSNMAEMINEEDPGQPEILAMLKEGEAYAAALYPAESNHFLSLDELRAPHVTFLVARDENGAALGTGAIALYGDWAEIKRMWVRQQARGRGLSKSILQALEEFAVKSGTLTARLETGIHNKEALALYERSGFSRCPPFAEYNDDPLSVFMEKTLKGTSGATAHA